MGFTLGSVDGTDLPFSPDVLMMAGIDDYTGGMLGCSLASPILLSSGFFFFFFLSVYLFLPVCKLTTIEMISVCCSSFLDTPSYCQ